MKPQHQRNQYDCCLAATASIMEVDYDVVFSPDFQAYIEEKKGTYGEDIAKVFSMAGLYDYKHVINYFGQGFTDNGDFQRIIREHIFHGLLWGRRALLQVPSLNNEGKSHLVAWAYDELWDPSNLKTYTELKGVIPEHIWVINEKRE